MWLVLGFAIQISCLLALDENEFICQLILVESSVRQPYSGTRCVDSPNYRPIIQIAYVSDDSYYCPTGGYECNCNTTNKPTIPSNKNDIKIVCATLRKSLVSTKCECCEGFQQDRFNACLPITKTTSDPDINVLPRNGGFSLIPVPEDTTATTPTTKTTTYELTTKQTSTTTTTTSHSTSYSHPTFLIIGILLALLLLLLLLLIILISCCFCLCGILAKKRKERKTKKHLEGIIVTADVSPMNADNIIHDKVKQDAEENHYEELKKVDEEVVKVGGFRRCHDNIYSEEPGNHVKKNYFDRDEGSKDNDDNEEKMKNIFTIPCDMEC